MKKITTVPLHKQNTPMAPAIQVIELGKATLLTLGGYGQSTEHVRSNQHRKK
jgi:hypothetical protein